MSSIEQVIDYNIVDFIEKVSLKYDLKKDELNELWKNKQKIDYIISPNTVSISSIKIFDICYKNRSFNDTHNKLREKIIEKMHCIDNNYFKHPDFGESW